MTHTKGATSGHHECMSGMSWVTAQLTLIDLLANQYQGRVRNEIKGIYVI